MIALTRDDISATKDLEELVSSRAKKVSIKEVPSNAGRGVYRCCEGR